MVYRHPRNTPKINRCTVQLLAKYRIMLMLHCESNRTHEYFHENYSDKYWQSWKNCMPRNETTKLLSCFMLYRIYLFDEHTAWPIKQLKQEWLYYITLDAWFPTNLVHIELNFVEYSAMTHTIQQPSVPHSNCASMLLNNVELSCSVSVGNNKMKFLN